MSDALGDDPDLDGLERDAVGYFLRATNPDNGLVADSSRPGAPCSIAATGLGLTAQVVGVERGFLPRREAAAKTLAALRFFHASAQSSAADATGYRGFYYHFLDMATGRRVWQCELSTIDTAILIAGVLVSGRYFSEDLDDERQIRDLARRLYDRVEWSWAMADGSEVRMGWRPEAGFLSYGWEGFSEAMLLYVLGLGSTTHPLPPESYHAWTGTFQWENLYDIEFLFAAPLFTHQLAQVWLDLRGIRDAYMRRRGSDYFENSRRATAVQRQYALRNPLRFAGYREDCWGVTAGLGPGFFRYRMHDGIERQSYGYLARGVPFGPDDGTLAPWAVAAALPFAPDEARAALRHFRDAWPESVSADGLLTSFNPSVPNREATARGWLATEHHGLDQGPVAVMIENYRSDLIWRLTRDCPPIAHGLRRAGFRGGWLASAPR